MGNRTFTWQCTNEILRSNLCVQEHIKREDLLSLCSLGVSEYLTCSFVRCVIRRNCCDLFIMVAFIHTSERR